MFSSSTSSHRRRKIGSSEMITDTAPLCVQSEQELLEHPDRLIRCCLNNDIDYRNRLENENTFYFAVNKYLDIDCDDEILYIDSTPKDLYSYWHKVIETKFCLAKPIDVCRLESLPTEKLYDKIIVKNCLKYFDGNSKEQHDEQLSDFLLSRLKEQTQQRTSVLIIQRVSDLNTLPLAAQTKREWSQSDVPYTKCMEALQRAYFNVAYDIETFRTVLACKSAWYEKICNTNEVYPVGVRAEATRRLQDVRELNEGVFKYHPFDECVELTDRMLFVAAYRPIDRQAVLVQRIRSMKDTNNYTSIEQAKLENEMKTLHLEMTPDIGDFIKKKKTNK